MFASKDGYGYLTPDVFTPTAYICGRLRIPNNELFLAAVMGALADLTRESSWQSFGTMTPEDAAYLALTMYNDFVANRGACMIGTVVAIATQDVPANMLLCDGTTYSKDDYPDLWSVINANLILSSTTFKTPDLRGRFVMADGDTGHPEYSIGGEYEHALIESELAFHQHTTNPHQHTYVGGNVISVPAGVDPIPASFVTPIPSLTDLSGYLTDNGKGGDTPHNTTPPYFVLRYCLVAK